MITGPELDLLQEVLADDPTADIYLDVAHALIDRGDARQATVVLRRALEYGVRDLDTARLLARTASDIGDDRGLQVAAETLGEKAMTSEPALARSYAVALDRAGKLDKAGELAASLLEAHGHDEELAAIVDRMNAALPEASVRARDPFFTVQRAEAYLESGRIDLAVRAYRRILAANPDDQMVHARLLRLRGMPREARPWVDDLSEEYWVTRPVSALSMPSPTLVPHIIPPADEETTLPGGPPRRAMPRHSGRGRDGGPPRDAFDDDEETTVVRSSELTGSAYEPSADDPESVTDLPTTIDPRSSLARAVEEDATVVVDPSQRRRGMPGIDELRQALAEDADAEARHPLADGDDDARRGGSGGDADSIIEEARAIERAADRRRRSLFRK